MAVKTSRVKTAMILEYDEGYIDEKQMISRKRYTVSPNATDEGIRQASLAIAELTVKTVLNTNVEKLENITDI